MKLLIMYSSPASRHFIPLGSKYSPQHPTFKHFASMLLPQDENKFHTYIK